MIHILTGPVPTHRCKVCGALWRYWRKEETGQETDSWNLRSSQCDLCCDSVPMDKQIEPLTWDAIRALLPYSNTTLPLRSDK